MPDAQVLRQLLHVGLLASGDRDVARVGLALDLAQQLGMFSLEEGMTELYLINGPFVLFEVIHVELANERVHILVLEVARQDHLDELLSLVNFEARSLV